MAAESMLVTDYISINSGDPALSFCKAEATYTGGIAIGGGSRAYGVRSIAIGCSARVNYRNTDKNSNSISIGTGASVNTLDSIAIGYNAAAKADESCTTASSNIAIGSDTISTNYNAIALGIGALSEFCSTTVGSYSSANNGSIAIGFASHSSGKLNTSGEFISNTNSIAIGYGNHATYGSTAIGNDSTADDHSIALGLCSLSEYCSIAAGNYSKANGDGSIAIGSCAEASNEDNISIGTMAQTTGSKYAISIGSHSEATDEYAISIGCSAKASGISIGVCSNSCSISNIAIGCSSNASRINAIAIGSFAKATRSCSIAIGGQAEAAHAGAIVLNATESSKSSSESNSFNVFTGGGVDKFYIDGTSLGGLLDAKASTTALANKVDTSTFNTAIASKANKATTLSGYGITDAYTKTATDTALAKKQDKLTAGDNITISADNVISAIGGGSSCQYVAINGDGTGCDTSATANGTQSIVIGPNAGDTDCHDGGQINSVAVGYDSHTYCVNGTVVGSQAKAYSPNAVAIGAFASALGDTSTCGGYGEGNIAIGTSAKVGYGHNECGDFTDITTSGSIAIGYCARAYNGNSVIIGRDTYTDSEGAILIGKEVGWSCIDNWTPMSAQNTVAIGTCAGCSVTEGGYSVMLGYSTRAFGFCSVAVGQNANANTVSIAIGAAASASSCNPYPGNEALAIGANSRASGDAAIVIGSCSDASNGAVIIGNSSSGGCGFSVSIGYDAGAVNSSCDTKFVSIGYGATSSDYGIAIGCNASVGRSSLMTTQRGNETNSIAIGGDSSTIGYCAIAIGTEATSSDNSIAIGNYASSCSPVDNTYVKQPSMAIGNSSTANAGIAIGYYAKAGSCGTYWDRPSVVIGNADLNDSAGLSKENIGLVAIGNYIGQNRGAARSSDQRNVIIGNCASVGGSYNTSVGDSSSVGFCSPYPDTKVRNSSAFGYDATIIAEGGNFSTVIGARTLSHGCGITILGAGGVSNLDYSTSIYTAPGPRFGNNNYSVRFTQVAGSTTDSTYYIFQHIHTSSTTNQTGVKISATNFFNMLKQFGGEDYTRHPNAEGND